MKERHSKKMCINSRGELEITNITKYTFTKKETIEKLLNEKKETPSKNIKKSNFSPDIFDFDLNSDELKEETKKVINDFANKNDIKLEIIDIDDIDNIAHNFIAQINDNLELSDSNNCLMTEEHCSHHEGDHLFVYFDNKEDFKNKIVTCGICGKRIKMLNLTKEYTKATFPINYCELLIENFLLYKSLHFYSDKDFETLMKIKDSIYKGSISQDDKNFILKIYNKIQLKNLEGQTKFHIPLRKQN